MDRGQLTGEPPARWRARRPLYRWLGAILLTMSVSVTPACSGETAVSRSGGTPAPKATGAPSGTDPAAVLEHAMQSLSRGGSVRTALDFSDHGIRLRNITHSAADRGRQDITLNGMHAAIRVVGNKTFARGDRPSLTGYFGLPDSTAQRLENRWYLLLDGDPGFDDATSGVTLPSLVAKVRARLPVEPLHVLRPTVRNGVRVTGVRGASPNADDGPDSTVTLWVSADARARPVELEMDDYSAHLQFVIDFDHWGDPVQVAAPTPAVRLATMPHLTVDG